MAIRGFFTRVFDSVGWMQRQYERASTYCRAMVSERNGAGPVCQVRAMCACRYFCEFIGVGIYCENPCD